MLYTLIAKIPRGILRPFQFVEQYDYIIVFTIYLTHILTRDGKILISMVAVKYPFLSLSQKRTLSEFVDFVKTDEGVELIQGVKKLGHIPDKGFEYTDNDKKIVEGGNAILFYNFIPEKAKSQKPYVIDMLRLVKQALIHNVFIQHSGGSLFFNNLMYCYIVFDKIIPEVGLLDEGSSIVRMEKMDDILYLINNYDFDDEIIKKSPQQRLYEHYETASKSYGHAIYLREDCSKNEAIKFIEKNWKPKDILRKRFRRKMERDEIIHKGGDKPLNEIAKEIALNNWQDAIEASSVGSIKRQQKKRKLSSGG